MGYGGYGDGWGSIIYRAPGGQKPAKSIITRKFMGRVLEYARPYKSTIILVLIAIAVKNVVSLIPPMLYRAIIDTAIPEKDKTLLGELASGLIAVPIVVGILGVFRSYQMSKVGLNIICDLRVATYDHLQRSSVRFFTVTKTGELMSRLSSDTRGARDAISSTFVDVVSNAANVCFTLGLCLYVEWRLTLVGLSFLPLFLVPSHLVAEKLRTLIRSQMNLYARLSAIAQQTLNISGVILTHTFYQADRNVTQYSESANELRETGARVSLVSALFSFATTLLSSFGVVTVYWWGGTMVIDGSISVGTLVSLSVYLTSLYGPITALVNSRVKIATSLVSFERVFEILDMDLEIDDKPDAISLDRVEGALTLDNVAFSYALANYKTVEGEFVSESYSGSDSDGTGGGFDLVSDDEEGDELVSLLNQPSPSTRGREGRGGGGGGRRRRRRRVPKRVRLPELKATERFWPRNVGMGGELKHYSADEMAKNKETYVIRNVSVDIAPGQIAAIVGPSGAGKTTLLSLLSRMYDVTSGSIRLDGHDLRDLSLATVAEHVATVTQESFLFNDSLKANLLFARADATDEEMREACRIANILDFVDSLPDGLDTVVGERGYRLSGGEKQRIAIARVVLKNPRVLILDEATASLDSVSERQVQAALDELMVSRTSVVVAHRLSTILNADVILVMDHGELVEAGTHGELLDQGGLYAHLFNTQFSDALSAAEGGAAEGGAAEGGAAEGGAAEGGASVGADAGAGVTAPAPSPPQLL